MNYGTMEKTIKKAIIAVFWLLVLAGFVTLTGITLAKAFTEICSVIMFTILLPIDILALVMFLYCWESIFESGDQF